MSHHRSQSVSCNGGQRTGGKPCGEKYEWHGSLPIREADGFVRSKGWHVRPDGRHICRTCWENHER